MGIEGFVLSGGMSRRMGQDKALLPFRETSLIDSVAATVARLTGSATIVGPPERYAHLPWPAIVDRRPGEGPLAGIETAMLAATASRVLIVACDMPGLEFPLLQRLSEARQADCVLPRTPDGRMHPLCAIWSANLLSKVQAALDRRHRRVLDALQGADLEILDVEALQNANTPEEWLALAK